jgi:hypothetical protein
MLDTADLHAIAAALAPLNLSLDILIRIRAALGAVLAPAAAKRHGSAAIVPTKEM